MGKRIQRKGKLIGRRTVYSSGKKKKGSKNSFNFLGSRRGTTEPSEDTSQRSQLCHWAEERMKKQRVVGSNQKVKNARMGRPFLSTSKKHSQRKPRKGNVIGKLNK